MNLTGTQNLMGTTAPAQVLLHVCCGPCSIMPILRLQAQGIAVTAYFMNPNIHPLTEYLRRREGMAQCADKLQVPVIWGDNEWNITQWLRDVAGAPQNSPKDCPPARCHYCYSTRLAATSRMASQHGFPAFSTSLLYSCYQNHDDIIATSQSMAQKENINFYYEDFRTAWQQGIDISKEWNIYRQPYCGCIYSETERYMKSLKKLF